MKTFFIDCDNTRLNVQFQKVSKFDVCEKMIVAGVKFLMEKRPERAKRIIVVCDMMVDSFQSTQKASDEKKSV